MEEALDKAVKRIELWRLIYDRCGITPEENTFWIDLADITGIPRPESQTKAVTVRKAYIDDAKYILSVEKFIKPAESEIIEARSEAIDRTTTMETQPIVSASAIGYIGYPEYSKAPLEIKDEFSYEMAQKMLAAIGKKLGIGKIGEIQNTNPNKGSN